MDKAIEEFVKAHPAEANKAVAKEILKILNEQRLPISGMRSEHCDTCTRIEVQLVDHFVTISIDRLNKARQEMGAHTATVTNEGILVFEWRKDTHT